MGHTRWLSPLAVDMQERWLKLTNDFNCEERAKIAALDILLSLYASWERKYHTLEHVADCLKRFDEAMEAGIVSSPNVTEMALWWHDAIYNPLSKCNESQSGVLARQTCLMMNCDPTAAHWVEIHISATRHRGTHSHPDTHLVCDIDLASLGYDWETFSSYSSAIRQEYAFMPQAFYCKGRIDFLSKLLARGQIYYTDLFCERYEAQARINIRKHIEDLRENIT